MTRDEMMEEMAKALREAKAEMVSMILHDEPSFVEADALRFPMFEPIDAILSAYDAMKGEGK